MQLTVEVQQWAGTGSEPIALTIDTGGINIGGTTNGSAASSVTATVTDGGSVNITITQDGYKSYEMTIDNVYAEDKTIYILLVEDITDASDPEYLMPHAYFYYFRDPCSFDVDVYNASSYTGIISWYLNNECLAEQSDNQKFTQEFTNEGNYQLKQATKTQRWVSTDDCGGGYWENAWLRQWANGDAYSGAGAQGETGNVTIGMLADDSDLYSYLQTDLQTNVTLTEYRPTFSLTVSEPTDEIDDTTCYTQYEDVTVTADVTLTREGADPAQHAVTWSVLAPDGLPVIDGEEQSLALATNAVTFQVSELGTYTITAVLTDLECGDTWTRETTIHTCNFVYIETTGTCSEYTIYNMSNQYDINYAIELIGGTGENDISGSIPANTTGTDGAFNVVTLVDAGIHSVTVTWYTDPDDPTSEQQQILILNNWCEIWDCLAGYINEVLCKPEELCNPCPDSLILNEMLLFNQTYSMMMNAEYEFNNYYSALDESKLMEFQEMNAVYAKMKELCDRLDCKSPCLSVTQKDTKFGFGMSPGNKSKGGCGC